MFGTFFNDWENVGGTVWKTVLHYSLFGSYNPYKDIIYGDWLFTQEKVFHTGEVYLNGKSMYGLLFFGPKKIEQSYNCKGVHSETRCKSFEVSGSDPVKIELSYHKKAQLRNNKLTIK